MTNKNTKPIDYTAEVRKAADEMRTWHEAAADAAQKLAQLAHDTIEGDAARAELIAVAARSGVPDHAQLDALNVGRAKRDEAREFLQEIVQRIDASLKQAEANHALAVRRQMHATAKDLVAARVSSAEKFDNAAKAMAEAVAEWERLGQQLLGLDLPIFHKNSISATENIIGANRLQQAFPTIAMKIFPAASGVFAGGGSLAVSERNQWLGLPAA